ncbi:MAG TPA: DUF697 domain-containing protein [Thiotrichaceae bacterium]|nr:DUF697 domain-containing protein [Thiotrichaceae bacterium]
MEQAERLASASNTNKKYVIASMGAGLIPLPMVDLVALTGVQLKMLHSLAKLYDVPFSKELGKSIMGSLLGGLIPAGAARASAGSLAKLIPIGGMAAGMITMSLFGGAATYAVGKVFIQHFESGGTFLTFDPNKVREHFQAEFEKGQEKVTTTLQEEPQAAAA